MPFFQMQALSAQVIMLLLLAIPVACICWTITHEEIFREAREYCVNRSHGCRRLYQRKFFFALTCEYCWIRLHTAPWFMKVVRIALAADRPL